MNGYRAAVEILFVRIKNSIDMDKMTGRVRFTVVFIKTGSKDETLRRLMAVAGWCSVETEEVLSFVYLKEEASHGYLLQ